MKKNIFSFIFIITLSLILNTNVKALTYGGCEYSQIASLKSYVSNVNLSYDYYMINDKAYFNITINNIVPGIYFVDSTNDKVYNYSNTNNGEITLSGYTNTNGNYKFYSALNECYGVKLGNKYYNLPIYNKYSSDELCKDNYNYTLCQKWTKVLYSYDEFKEKIEEYNRSKIDVEDNEEIKIIYNKTILDYIVDFYTKYYYFILLGIIIICVIVMYFNRKKNRFDI